MGFEQVGLEVPNTGETAGGLPWRRSEERGMMGGPLKVVLIPRKAGQAPAADQLAQAGIALHEQVAEIGSIAENFGNQRMAFAAGVVTASATWLTLQGLGARMLAPLFTRPATWRVLDGTIAAILSVLALTLAIRGVN